MSPDSTGNISLKFGKNSRKKINLKLYYYAPIRRKKQKKEKVTSKLNNSVLK